ncbi:GntR family transcriptional regulator [Echinicola vietnamensis]|uniref:Putative transcriptional regulator n=1 Tax=Echinicola vietnamensis (strain DSM 17526 / LMG 23754 / KMM 6221) TaxID=926556 RepID=L0G4N7_ECHVK|nr:GntR family transcriptional regulator [Echinicola vietnamensis]AGA79976.1 putative transcriptional regulator [Echinicola vietnamensis DSM 17526]
MEFNESRNIFLQIADWLCDQILREKFPPGERVPSVRELAEEMEVNRNTVMRTYSILQDQGILDNKRGIGFFVADNAPQKIHKRQKADFLAHELPQLIHRVKVLGLSAMDLKPLLKIIDENNHKIEHDGKRHTGE